MTTPTRRWARTDATQLRILDAATEVFSTRGFSAATMADIVEHSGASIGSIYHHFGGKKELFLACHDRACEKILEVFRRAAADAEPGQKMEAMGHAYLHELLPDRHALFMLMQAYAATSDPELRDHVRRRYGEVITAVSELSGASDDEVWRFFATGMHLNIVTALDLAAIAGENRVVAAWQEMFEKD